MSETDVIIENQGTIIVFMPMTEKAENWIADNVPDPLYFGHALCCEPRYAHDLAEGMQESGITISRGIA